MAPTARVLGVLCISAIAGVLAAPWNVAPPASLMKDSLSGDTPPWMNYTQTQSWFPSQLLDHFNMADARVWSQRYFVIDQFWDKPNGPILLHICGEYTCQGIFSFRKFPVEIAYEHGALIVTLEHRFFGESLPLPDSSTANLGYHNSRQAINDLAYFQQWFQGQLEAKYGAKDNTWVNVGGSYPGALSAWFRLKFPHLTAGAHSSSGVVHAILNYTAFDEQVATSAGTACADALRAITKDVEDSMPEIKGKFTGASSLRDGDFYYLMADAGAEAIQYGHRHVLCDAVTPPFVAGQSPIPAWVNFVNNYFFKVMGNAALDYDSTLWESDITNNARSWWWQKCTELAYWQVAPEEGSIRSHNVNYTFHRELCHRVFGLTTLPEVEATNNYYGGANPVGSNIYFANGVEDPWQWAGVRTNLTGSPTLTAKIVDCDQCAHCVDLYTPTPEDAPQLVNERNNVRAAYQKWLSEPH